MNLFDQLNKSNRSRQLKDLDVQNFFKDINLSIFKGKRVLDVGCGNGDISVEFKKKFNFDMFTSDILESENPKLRLQTNFVKGNFLNLHLKDFKNESFDFIYSFRMFLHLKPSEKFTLIKKLYEEFLKIGGVLLIDFTGDAKNNNYSISKEDDNLLNMIIQYIKNEKGGIEIIEKEYENTKGLKYKSKTLKVNKK